MGSKQIQIFRPWLGFAVLLLLISGVSRPAKAQQLKGAEQSCLELFLRQNDLSSADLNPTDLIDEPIREASVDFESVRDIRSQIFEEILFSKTAAERIGRSLENTVDRKQISTVVYPGAGYDAGTAFAMFPEATTVIGIDRHQFTNDPKEIIYAEVPELTGSKYTYYGDIDRYVEKWGLAGAIIGNLAASFPSFRLLRVVQTAGPRRVHGWIDFDLGPGTPLRRYIHWDHIISESENPQWLPRLKEIGFQAMLVKGSVHIFEIVDSNYGGNGLLSYLADTGGVVVDTDVYLPESIVAVAIARGIKPTEVSPRQNYVLTGTGVKLGYNLDGQTGLGSTIIQYVKP